LASADAAAAALQGVARALRELARVPSRASGPASKAIAKLIDDEFANGTDPYGKPWRPIKDSTIARKGSSQINIETTDLRRGIDVRPMRGAGIQITVSVPYAVYVQRVRPVLPTRQLPSSWAQAIATAMTTAKRDWAKSSGSASAPIIDSADAMLELAQLLGSIPSDTADQ
jgi:hypothetical protein